MNSNNPFAAINTIFFGRPKWCAGVDIDNIGSDPKRGQPTTSAHSVPKAPAHQKPLIRAEQPPNLFNRDQSETRVPRKLVEPSSKQRAAPALQHPDAESFSPSPREASPGAGLAGSAMGHPEKGYPYSQHASWRTWPGGGDLYDRSDPRPSPCLDLNRAGMVTAQCHGAGTVRESSGTPLDQGIKPRSIAGVGNSDKPTSSVDLGPGRQCSTGSGQPNWSQMALESSPANRHRSVGKGASSNRLARSSSTSDPLKLTMSDGNTLSDAKDPSKPSGMASHATARDCIFMMCDDPSQNSDSADRGETPLIASVEYGPSTPASRRADGITPPLGRELIHHLARRGLDAIIQDDNTHQSGQILTNQSTRQGSEIHSRDPGMSLAGAGFSKGPNTAKTTSATGSTLQQIQGREIISRDPDRANNSIVTILYGKSC